MKNKSDIKAAIEFVLFITAIILMSIVAGLIIKGVTIFCVNYIWS